MHWPFRLDRGSASGDDKVLLVSERVQLVAGQRPFIHDERLSPEGFTWRADSRAAGQRGRT